MNDKTLESKALTAIQYHAKMGGWSETFSKVVITSPSWQIVRDKNTNSIIGRIVVAACVAKWPKGNCTYQYFSFMQDHQGGGKYLDALRVYSTGYKVLIDCSSIK